MIKWISQPHRYRFCLRNLQSPTFYNLSHHLLDVGWKPTRFRIGSQLNEQHFDFDEAVAQQLEFKHLLAQLVAKYCPQVMPLTYCINDENWPLVLNELAHLPNLTDPWIWILKPALLNNGQFIKIFDNPHQIAQHYLSKARLGGEHVLQQYITHPHLLRGHKYSIRLFVILTNYHGSYLYRTGYFNVAVLPYQPLQFSDLRCHLTNEHLAEPEHNVVQIPTSRMDLFSSLYPGLKEMSHQIIDALQQEFPHAFIRGKKRKLAIFGFDFMVDEAMRIWFLEANHGPCFPIDNNHPLQKYVYQNFWQDFIFSFVIPIAKHQAIEQIEYQSFERL